MRHSRDKRGSGWARAGQAHAVLDPRSGCVVTMTAIPPVLSYIESVLPNLVGPEGSVVQSLATMVDSAFQRVSEDEPDWPIVAANFPRVISATVALATAW